MKSNELITIHTKSGRRVGRGIAAGQGKTAGRGTKGYGSRTGSKARPGFTGGQNPLMQKLPKLPGFRSHRIPMETVYTNDLAALGQTIINAQVLADAGMISSPYVQVKLLARGDLASSLTIELQAASTTATNHVTNAGGTVSIVPRTPRPAKQTIDHTNE